MSTPAYRNPPDSGHSPRLFIPAPDPVPSPAKAPLLRKDGTPRNKPGPKPKPKKPPGKPGRPRKGFDGSKRRGETDRGIQPRKVAGNPLGNSPGMSAETLPKSPCNSPPSSSTAAGGRTAEFPGKSPQNRRTEASPHPRSEGDGARGHLAKKLLHREKGIIVEKLHRVGRVTSCNAAGVTYPRFLRELKTNPEFALAVRTTEMMKDEFAEDVIYGLARAGDLKACAVFLNYRLKVKRLQLACRSARWQRKLVAAQVRALEGTPREPERSDLSRLTKEQLQVLEAARTILAGCPRLAGTGRQSGQT